MARWWIVATIWASACSADIPKSTALTFSAVGAPIAVGGGEQFVVTVHAIVSDDIDAGSVSVSFTTNATGVAFTQAAVTLDGKSDATASVLVPYGTTVVAQASTADGGLAVQTLAASPVSITLAPHADAMGSTATGELIDVTATATTDAGNAVGVSLAFATNAMGVTFAPSSAVTDDQGEATSHVFVPSSMLPVVGIASGGGAVAATTIASVQFGQVNVGNPVGTSSGSASTTTYPVSISVLDATTSAPLAGVTVTFAAVAGATCTPGSVTTNTSGTATSQVSVPAGGNTEVVISAAGAVAAPVSVP